MSGYYDIERTAQGFDIDEASERIDALVKAARELLDDVAGYGLKHPEDDARFEPESADRLRAALASLPGMSDGAGWSFK